MQMVITSFRTMWRQQGSLARQLNKETIKAHSTNGKYPLTSLIGRLFLITTTKGKVDVSGRGLEILKQ